MKFLNWQHIEKFKIRFIKIKMGHFLQIFQKHSHQCILSSEGLYFVAIKEIYNCCQFKEQTVTNLSLKINPVLKGLKSTINHILEPWFSLAKSNYTIATSIHTDDSNT